MGAKRDDYVEKLKAKILEWDVEITKFQAAADKGKKDAQVQYLERIEGLKAGRRKIEEDLARLQKAGEEAWEQMKSGVDTAWYALDESVEAVKSGFKS